MLFAKKLTLSNANITPYTTSQMTDHIQQLIKKSNCLVDDINQLLHNEGIEFTRRLEIVTSFINYKFNGLEPSCGINKSLEGKICDILKTTILDRHELIQKVFMFYGSKTLKIELDQFYTPITIGCFINSLCIPGKKFIDPACGTGDLAINYHGDITLWDVSPDVTKICEFNYKLNSKECEVTCINSIRSYNRDNGVYDYCAVNPPFGSSTVVTDKDVLSHYELGRNKSKEEIGILFIERSIKLLKNDGVAFIILPNGYLGNSSKSTKDLRDYLLSYRIISIIELPSNSFARSGTGVSTSLIIIQKRKMTQPYDIAIRRIDNIGYVLNKKNTPYKYKTYNGDYILTDGKPVLDNDLTDCFDEIVQFINKEKIANLSSHSLHNKEILNTDVIRTDKLHEDILDINRYLSVYTNIISDYVSNNCRTISDYIDTKATGKFTIIKDKEYVYLDIKQITSPVYSKSNVLYGYDLPGRAKIMLKKYDIIVSKLKGKISFAMILEDVDYIVCTNGFTLLRPNNYESAIIIFANLFSNEFKVQHNSLCTGSIMASVSEKEVKNMYINHNINLSKYKTVVDALITINHEL